MLFHLAFMAVVLTALQTGPSSNDLAEELLRADRGFSSRGASTDMVAALAAMFSDEVIVPGPAGEFIDGKSRVVEALKANADNARATATWTPVRAGVSADGQHGFTFGYMTVKKGDGTEQPMKYLSYWIKRSEGWKVAVYRRRPRPDGPVSTALMSPSLPPQPAPSPESHEVEHSRSSLAAAEKAFSDEAQTIGLTAAFTKYGRADAINMGGPKEREFVVGSAAIGRSVGEGTPDDNSPVRWAADYRVLVASSGDLGVTLGFIHSNAPAARPPVPFFTIWRRDRAADPWRYIAE